MMNYIEAISTNEITGEEFRDINVQNDDGSIKAFPVDNSNPAYISFLRQLSEENPDDPHFVEWVEAGNNPEDFWDRSDDLNETIVSEENLPSEEETKIETDLGE